MKCTCFGRRGFILLLVTTALMMTITALPAQTPVNFKIAFIGDQGLGSDARAVLNLIRSEGAHAVLHQGDFDYTDDPAAWEAQINDVLGANFPYFASVGNHDETAWAGYQQYLENRLNRLGISWDGDLGTKSSLSYSGIFIVLVAPDIIGSGHDVYIRDKLAADNSIWSICSWHKNMHAMQVGDKSDETGWGVYEESRKGGAIIATAHEHSYSRTHLLSSCQNQTVASTSNTLVLTKDAAGTSQDEGRTFAFVSGMGGKSIRDQQLDGDWWASIYTATQNANYGALFGVFNLNGEANKAHFYFKDIDGRIADDFYVTSNVTGSQSPSAPTISSFSPTSGPVGTAVTILGNNFTGATRVAFNGTPAGSFTVASNTEIRTTVPAGATTGRISVATPGGTATSSGDFTVTQPSPSALTISSFSPTSGPVGTAVTILGNNFNGATQVAFNGTPAGSFTVASNTEIRTSVPAGATTGRISVATPGGTATSSNDFAVNQSPPAGTTITLNPTDDAYVESSNEQYNHGSSSSLRAKQSSSIYNSYLKFVVSGLSGTVVSAKLRLRVTEGSDSGGSIFLVSNNYRTSSTPWTEDDITYENAPGMSGNALRTVGEVSDGEWVEFDVTAAISGNGTFSFGLKNASSSTVRYSAKEGDDIPELVIQITPPPAISSFNPTSGIAGTEVTILGSNFSGATQVSFNGVATGSFTIASDSNIRVKVPVGATTGKISVTAPGGMATSNDDFIVTQPLPQTVRLNSTEDAYVKSSDDKDNYGSSSTLRAKQSSTIYNSYLKFVVGGLSGTVVSAKLRLRVTEGSDSGGSIFLVSNNYRTSSTPWAEDDITYENAPSMSSNALSTVGEVSDGEWVEFNVTAAINGNGTFSFGLKNASSSTVKYSSKEGNDAPELVIQTGGTASGSDADALLKSGASRTLGLAAPLPDRITLAPNYPNPFNAQTVIAYALPEAAHVRLAIYNLVGQRVRQLVDETQPAGHKHALWDGRDDHGRDVGSGVYLYRLQVGPQTFVQKMTLQK